MLLAKMEPPRKDGEIEGYSERAIKTSMERKKGEKERRGEGEKRKRKVYDQQFNTQHPPVQWSSWRGFH